LQLPAKLLKRNGQFQRERNPGIPEELATIIDRTLTERPQIGCKDASELRMQIEAALR
jgi:hypothetical protein